MRNPKLAWLPYIAPLALFLLLTQFETFLGVAIYPALYCAKVAIVGIVVFIFIRSGAYPELRWEWRQIPPAIGFGIVLCILWVLIDSHTPHFKALGGRSGFDPWAHPHRAWSLPLFLAVRFIGLVALSPVIEELFYRSFLLRFAIDPNGFQSAPIGVYEPVSCAFAVIVMAAGHTEWLAAAVFSLAMNLLIYRTKSLFACIATHATTNLALGIYVVTAHAWTYW